MSDAIKEGDTVRLKSGGPLMTAASVAPEGVNCEWFDEKDQAQFKQFKATSLSKDDGGIAGFSLGH